MMINAGANAKNWLIYAMKDLLGILVTVSANVINPVILVSIWTINIKKKCKKRLVNKLVELSSAKECTENIEKIRLK